MSLGQIVLSWLKITQGQCEICLKSKFSLILLVYNLVIGYSKKNRENYLRKCFKITEKETQIQI